MSPSRRGDMFECEESLSSEEHHTDAHKRVRSRRKRVGEMDAAVLTQMVRRALVEEFAQHSGSHIAMLAENAALRGSEEAAFVWELICKKGPIPDIDLEGSLGVGALLNAQLKRWNWVAQQTANDESLWALLYRGVALLRLGDPRGMTVLRAAVQRGCVPAAGELGRALFEQFHSENEGIAFLLTAADGKDATGLYWLGRADHERRFELWTAAAARGHILALQSMVQECSKELGVMACAALSSRAALCSGVCDLKVLSDIDFDGNDFTNGEKAIIYVVGRELEGYEQLWNCIPQGPELRMSVVHFLHVNCAARRAALQTLHLRVPRDVAVLIAMAVYRTREDALAWWDTEIGCEDYCFESAGYTYGGVWVHRKSSSWRKGAVD